MVHNAYDNIISVSRQMAEEYELNKISVRMICQCAGVNRQTFYYHFNSMTDLFRTIIKTELEKQMENCRTYHNWVEGYRIFLNYMRKNRGMILHICNTSYRTDFFRIVRISAEHLIKHNIDRASRDIKIPISEKNRDFMVHFYVAVFVDILERFIYNGIQDDPGEIAYQCERMMDRHIRHSIRRFAEKIYAPSEEIS